MLVKSVKFTGGLLQLPPTGDGLWRPQTDDHWRSVETVACWWRTGEGCRQLLAADGLFVHHAHLFARLGRIGVPIYLSELIHLLLAWLSV